MKQHMTEQMKHLATFSIKSWQEQEIADLTAPTKLKSGRVEREHKGYISGSETMHYHFVYSKDDRSEFNGIGILDGVVGDRKGKFAIIERGSYVNGGVIVEFEVRQLSESADIGFCLGKGTYQTSAHDNIDYEFTECPD